MKTATEFETIVEESYRKQGYVHREKIEEMIEALKAREKTIQKLKKDLREERTAAGDKL